IIVLDMGLQLPGGDQPGVDFIIPNSTYLKENAHKIRGIFLTNGHYDHIGAVPYILSLIPGVDIFATAETFAVLENRRNFVSQDLDYRKRVIKSGSSVRPGSFKVDAFRLNHNIPGNLGLCVYTQQGKIVYTPNFKFDYTPLNEPVANVGDFAKYSDTDIFALLVGSNAADQEGYAPSEQEIGQEIERYIHRTSGKVVVTTYPSMLNRIQQIITAAEHNNRHVFIEGKSILNTFNAARKKGIIQVQKGTIVGPQVLKRLPDEQLVVLCTGYQGDDVPHFIKIMNREHPTFVLNEGDSAMFPSSLVPGNERSIAQLKDNIAKQDATTYHTSYLDIYSGAHAHREDIKIMMNIINPKFVIPIKGHDHLLRANADTAQSLGYPDKHIPIGRNGNVMIFDFKNRIRTKERVTASNVMVDGLGVGDLKEVVLRDRQMMSEDGILNIVLIIDSTTHTLYQAPEVMSRGFVYMKESEELIDEVKEQVRLIGEGLLQEQKSEINASYIRDELREQIGKFLFARTERRPMVLPIVVEV
ncbi:MAG: ribonuclease J, partial [Candidatus Paceibacteria bacterium]